MKLILVIVFFLILTGCNVNYEEMQYDLPIENDTNNLLNSWIGKYEFEEYIEGIGSPIWRNYKITIYEEYGINYADIIVDGFQTMIRARAFVQGNDESIEFIFESFLPNDLFRIYNTGDILLSFSRENDVIITTWGKIKSFVDENQEPGVYFEYDPDPIIHNDSISNETSELHVHYIGARVTKPFNDEVYEAFVTANIGGMDENKECFDTNAFMFEHTSNLNIPAFIVELIKSYNR